LNGDIGPLILYINYLSYIPQVVPYSFNYPAYESYFKKFYNSICLIEDKVEPRTKYEKMIVLPSRVVHTKPGVNLAKCKHPTSPKDFIATLGYIPLQNRHN